MDVSSIFSSFIVKPKLRSGMLALWDQIHWKDYFLNIYIYFLFIIQHILTSCLKWHITSSPESHNLDRSYLIQASIAILHSLAFSFAVCLTPVLTLTRPRVNLIMTIPTSLVNTLVLAHYSGADKTLHPAPREAFWGSGAPRHRDTEGRASLPACPLLFISLYH